MTPTGPVYQVPLPLDPTLALTLPHAITLTWLFAGPKMATKTTRCRRQPVRLAGGHRLSTAAGTQTGSVLWAGEQPDVFSAEPPVGGGGGVDVPRLPQRAHVTADPCSASSDCSARVLSSPGERPSTRSCSEGSLVHTDVRLLSAAGAAKEGRPGSPPCFLNQCGSGHGDGRYRHLFSCTCTGLLCVSCPHARNATPLAQQLRMQLSI